jgi:cysteine-rich repeat protein
MIVNCCPKHRRPTSLVVSSLSPLAKVGKRRKSMTHRNHKRLRCLMPATAALLLCLGLGSGTALAQCAGDCNGNNNVAINELILAVNISLGLRSIDDCRAADVNGNDAVGINELILAVNRSLDGCPMLATPTPTPSEPTAVPTETPTPPAGCGDGVVDLPGGETCDDGNLEEGDACPANCRIASCEPSGETLAVDLNYTTNPASNVSGMQLFLRYPDGVVGIPGRTNEMAVRDRITSPNFSITPNDRDYGLTLVLLDPTFFGPEMGTAVTATFDRCVGADRPTADDFRCDLESVSDPSLIEIVGNTNCTIVVR